MYKDEKLGFTTTVILCILQYVYVVIESSRVIDSVETKNTYRARSINRYMLTWSYQEREFRRQ